MRKWIKLNEAGFIFSTASSSFGCVLSPVFPGTSTPCTFPYAAAKKSEKGVRKKTEKKKIAAHFAISLDRHTTNERWRRGKKQQASTTRFYLHKRFPIKFVPN